MKKIITKKYKGEKYGYKDYDIKELTTEDNAGKYLKVNAAGDGITVGDGGGGGGEVDYFEIVDGKLCIVYEQE